MDEIDLRLCLLLREQPRAVYRELADEVDLSVNAVHSRIKDMKDKGIIGGFKANIGQNAFPRSLELMIHGFSEKDDTEEILEELEDDKNTFRLVTTSDDYLYVYGLIRDMAEMSQYVASIPESLDLRDSKVFLFSKERSNDSDFRFVKTDYRIIDSLHEDSRKSFSQVADDVGVSTKTVRRRIDKMKDAEAIDFSIRWYPVYSDDFIGIIHGNLRSKNREGVLTEIKRKYYPNVFEFDVAGNDPDSIILNTWARNLNKLKKLREGLKSTELFDSMKTRMFYDIHYFETWRKDLLKEKLDD